MARLFLPLFLILSIFLGCQKKVEVVNDLKDSGESTEANESLLASKHDDLPTEFINADTFIVLDNGLCMRDLPNTDGTVIGVLTKGMALISLNEITDKVDIGAYSAPWFKVQTFEEPLQEGWVYGAFIGPVAKDFNLSDSKSKTSILNGHPGGVMKNGLKRVLPQDMTADLPLQIPEGDGPLVSFESNEGKGVLVFKGVRLSKGLEELIITATDPLGNEFTTSIDSDDVHHLYEDLYNSRIGINNTFFVGFEPVNNSKPGVWQFTLTQAILLYDDPGTEPIYTTLDLTLDLSSTQFSVVPENRNPFEPFSFDIYHPGESLSIYGTGLKAESIYELGLCYEAPFRGDEGDIEYYPQSVFTTVTDKEGEFTVEIVLGRDLPLGNYSVLGGIPGQVDLSSVDFIIQK